MRRILTPLDVKVTFRPNITMKQLLVRPKDRAPDRERANVVYQVPCANCPAAYVGQTGRQLHQRLREHRWAVESGDCANSALAEHAWGCRHPFDWDCVRVLDCHPHLHQRLTLESVHIRSQSKPVNRDLGTMPQIYSPSFNSIPTPVCNWCHPLCTLARFYCSLATHTIRFISIKLNSQQSSPPVTFLP